MISSTTAATAGLADVGHHDPCALVGEQMGGGAAHPAGRTRDDRHLAGDRSREAAQTFVVLDRSAGHGLVLVVLVVMVWVVVSTCNAWGQTPGVAGRIW